MKRWCLAVTYLLVGSVGLACADYIVIIANLGERPDPSTIPGAFPGGIPGAIPGMPGIGEGGFGEGPGGPAGFPPGVGEGGFPPGIPEGSGYPGSGIPPGGEGYYGDEGIGLEVDPYVVVAVIEVLPTRNGFRYFKDPKYLAQNRPVTVIHRWGGTAKLYPRFGITRAIYLERNGKPMPTLGQRYKDKHKEVFEAENPLPADLLELAKWALAHGMVPQCAEVMDEFVKKDEMNAVAKAYVQVKKDLEKPLPARKLPGELTNLLRGYHTFPPMGTPPSSTYHYTLLHDSSSNNEEEVEKELKELERAFRGFYYWWALRGVALPVPQERLLAVLTSKPENFGRYEEVLTSGSVVADGFYARREQVVILSRERHDQAYTILEDMSRPYWEKGFHRKLILKGTKEGVPPRASPVEKYQAQLMALVMESMDEEARRTRISHEVSRQLLFASGLLANNVQVPEWLLFGMGSFFESPPRSPWPSLGAPSIFYLPRFKEMRKEKKLEETPYDTLVKVVTDGYFLDPRLAPGAGEKDSPIKASLSKEQRKAQILARTTAWSLVYFLAERKRTELLAFFKELSKMPRDLPINRQAALQRFARAFGAVDSSGQGVDRRKLITLANQWYSYTGALSLEAEDLVNQLRQFYAEAKKKPKRKPNRPTFPPGTVPPGTVPPGTRPPFGDDCS